MRSTIVAMLLFCIHLKTAPSTVKLATQANLYQFGAKGDGITDDTQAIIEALNSKVPVIYAKPSKAYYRVSNQMVLKNISNKTFIATGAKILNTDLSKATFYFENCKKMKFLGGEFGYESMPKANGGNSQHVFQFNNSQNIIIDNVHVNRSPEMGIALTNCNNVIVKNSLIENTFRDGTYAHYSANISYVHNTYRNIKDDAMSFHDYGIDTEKIYLRKFGYKQATNIVARDNKIENVYQGFGSIGATNVKVINNKIKGTVIAGIAVFNSSELYTNGTAYVNGAYIYGNTVDNACKDLIINNVQLANNGQASTGRAAIFVGSLGKNNQLNAGEIKRLKKITIQKNKVSNSGANGFVGNKIDNLIFRDNAFYNCSGKITSKSLDGDVIELSDITNFIGDNNAVIDNRPNVQHQYGYKLYNVSGKSTNWNVKGVLEQKKLILGKNNLTEETNIK